jgi:general stress protein 26
MATSQAEPKTREDKIAKLGSMIKGIKFAMLTTADPDGVMRSRPMATQDAEFDGELWFFTRGDSGKVHSIEKDQHVNVAYADPDKHHYVSVAGRGYMVHDKEKMAELWNPALKAWFPDGLEDPEISLLRVDVDSAEIWDSPSSSIVHLIGMAKAAITGKPLDDKTGAQHIELKH